MADENIKQVMQDAILDADSLERFINGSDSETVLTRLSAEYPTLQNAIKQMFENGGLPATPFATKALMTASTLIDGDYAIVTDDGSDNGLYIKNGSWSKSQYGDKELILNSVKSLLMDTVASYGEEVLVNKNKYYSTDNMNADTSDLIPVHEGQVLSLKSWVSGIAYRLYSLRKKSAGYVSSTGLFSEDIIIPKGVSFIELASINSNHASYTPNNFSLTIREFKSDNIKGLVRSFGYQDFVDYGLDGAYDYTYPNAKYMIFPVKEGQVIEYNNLITSGMPNASPLMLLDSDYELIQRIDSNSAVVPVPEGVTYAVVNTISEENALFNDDIRNTLYVEIKSAKTLKDKQVADRIESLESNEGVLEETLNLLLEGGATHYDVSYFNKAGSSTNYIATPRIPIGKSRHVFFVGQHPARASVFGYDANGVKHELLPFNADRRDIAAYIEIPSNIVEVEFDSLKEYMPSFEPFAVIGLSKKEVLLKASEVLAARANFNDFPLKQTHATYTNATHYDSTLRIPVVEGTVVDYSLNAGAYAGAFRDQDGVRTYFRNAAATWTAPSNGYVQLSIFNSETEDYKPDYNNRYSITYPTTGESNNTGVAKSSGVLLAGDYLPTPTLKAVREINFLDGTVKKPMQYLWHDQANRFYLSNTKRGDKHYIFTYDIEKMHNLEPDYFSMAFDRHGNILCVFRIDTVSYSSFTEESRKNPIILIKDEGYKPYEIDFGSDIKPCAWTLSAGQMCTEDAFFIAEYTRPSVQTANAWKATYPLSDPANWKRVQTFELSPNAQPADRLKHMHQVERDPYTGFIYTSTGDNSPGSAIYVSKDGGETFEAILEGSEKHCRVINFVYADDGYIYWATDSSGARHWLFRVKRREDGVMDMNNIEEILQFPESSQPTYGSFYLQDLKCIVFLGRDDYPPSSEIYIWDLTDEQLKLVGEVPSLNPGTAPVGFRVECFEYFPRDNEIICGFSQHKGNKNYNGVLGNGEEADKKVNNMIIRVSRVKDGFGITFDTTT